MALTKKKREVLKEVAEASKPNLPKAKTNPEAAYAYAREILQGQAYQKGGNWRNILDKLERIYSGD